MKWLEIFSQRLLALRKNRNWTQEEAAIECGMPFRTYRRYETGEREPQVSSFVKIADTYQVSLDYLAGRTDDPKFEGKSNQAEH